MGGKGVQYGVVLGDSKVGDGLEMANPSMITRPRRGIRLDG